MERQGTERGCQAVLEGKDLENVNKQTSSIRGSMWPARDSSWWDFRIIFKLKLLPLLSDVQYPPSILLNFE